MIKVTVLCPRRPTPPSPKYRHSMYPSCQQAVRDYLGGRVQAGSPGENLQVGSGQQRLHYLEQVHTLTANQRNRIRCHQRARAYPG